MQEEGIPRMTKLIAPRIGAIDDIEDYSTTSEWVWGKACKLSEKTWEVCQRPVKCKDYIIDPFYVNYADTSDFTKEEYGSCCFYIFLPSNAKELFFRNITDFLHLYETTNGYTPTVITQITKRFNDEVNWLPIIIEGDMQWMQNTYTLSHYLSLIRMCGYHTGMSLTSCGKSATVSCNESGYIRGLAQYPAAYKTFLHIWKEPHFLDMVAPEGYHPKSLYQNNKGHNGHGVGGYFFYLSQCRGQHTPEYLKTALNRLEKDNPMLEKISLLYREYNVKV
jgi:hypothetical protein